MGCHSFQPNLSTRPATSTSTRTLQRYTTSQPSTRHLPIRPFCEPSLHNHPLHQRLRIPIPPFRILLLRGLRLPLPLFARTCRSRRTFDSLGDHRAACAQSGVLRSRGGPLECAAASAAKPVHGSPPAPDWQTSTSNMSSTSMIGASKSLPTAWHCGGAQLAVDATLVSPLTRAGEPPPPPGQVALPEQHSPMHAKPKNGPTPNSFTIAGAALSY